MTIISVEQTEEDSNLKFNFKTKNKKKAEDAAKLLAVILARDENEKNEN
jgi:hypothetical protein